MSDKPESENPDLASPKRHPLTVQETREVASDANARDIRALSGDVAERDSRIHELEVSNEQAHQIIAQLEKLNAELRQQIAKKDNDLEQAG